MESFARLARGRNGDIDRGTTFTKGECLSTLSSPLSAARREEREKVGGGISGERDKRAKYVTSRFALQVARQRADGVTALPVAPYVSRAPPIVE